MSDKLRMALAAKFRVVARDRLVRLRDLTHAIESNPESAPTSEELLRELHTLKGEARMMGFAQINEIAHQGETLMIYAREVGVASLAQLPTLLIRALDAMSAILDDLPLPNDFDAQQFAATVAAIVSGNPPPGSSPGIVSVSRPDTLPFAPTFTPPQAAPPAALPAPALQAPPTGHSSTTLAALKLDTPTPPAPQSSSGTPAVSASSPGMEGLRQQIGDIRINRAANEGVRVSTTRLDQLTLLTGELVLEHTREQRQLETIEDTLRLWRAAHQRQSRLILSDCPAPLRKPLEDWFLKELQWMETAEHALQRLREESFDNEARLANLEANVRTLRLVPLGPLFAHFRRALLDLAREQGKQAQVSISGDDVELDAEVIGHISEPMVHLIRNCVDHGIEAPHERVMVQKHPRASVHVSARRSGAHVDISISDDGRGLNTDAIRARAIERNLLNPLENAPDQAIWSFIFAPGFSTREQATDISGRGVGLDVVKQRIESLGGHVSVDSEPNRGTRFTLAVPVSVAIGAVLVIEVGGQFYGLPSEVTAGVVQISPGDIEAAGRGLAFKYQDKRLALIDLHPLLDARAPSDEVLVVVIIQQQQRRIGLWVSRCVGERQSVQRPLDPFVEGLKLINGTSVLDTGDLVLILNAAEILRAGEGAGYAQHISSAALRPKGRFVLVVDDSELTRDLVVSTLKAWSYETDQAENGIQALSSISARRPNLVITDIDMPEMDGFSLLRAIRAAPEVRDIPVIVLSTRGSDRDKRTALQLGADGYMVKSSFNPPDFKRLIQRFVA